MSVMRDSIVESLLSSPSSDDILDDYRLCLVAHTAKKAFLSPKLCKQNVKMTTILYIMY